jgi:hypothetical protein
MFSQVRAITKASNTAMWFQTLFPGSCGGGGIN